MCQTAPCPSCPPIVSNGTFIFLEDPACFLRSLETFVNYAWIAIYVITAFLLLGWAFALIRGAKGGATAFATNMRNLVIMFGILAAARPIANMIFGEDLFSRGCNVIQVPVAEVNKIIDSAKLKLTPEKDLYEDLNIIDSASTTGMPGSLGEINAMMPDSVADSDGITSYQSGGASAASASSNRVQYTRADGSTFYKVGGSSSWRNNNPGNITCNPSTGRPAHGGIGCNGRFEVFQSEEVGTAKNIAKLKSNQYQNAVHPGCPEAARGSLLAAICVWAPPPPPDNNDPRSYARQIASALGVPMSTQMSSFNDAQLQEIARQQQIREGWKVGRIEG